MIKRLVIAGMVLLALSAAAAAFLLTTSRGLQTVSFIVSNLSAGRLVIGASHGKILGDWRLEHITVHADGVDVSIDRLSCRWQPKRLLDRVFQAAHLSLENVEIALKEQGDGEPAGGFIPPDITLPLALITSLEIKQLNVVTLGGTQLYTVDSFTAKFSASGNRLELRDVLFASQYLSGSAEGNLVLSGNWPIELGSRFQASPPGCSAIKGRLAVSQTLAHPQMELAISAPAPLQLDLGVTNLFDAPSFQAVLTGSSVELGGICDSFPEALADFDLTAGGDLENVTGNLLTTVQLAEGLPVSAQLDYAFDGQALTINQGMLGYGENISAISGAVTFAPQLAWDGVVLVDSFNISDLAPVAATSVDGRIKVSGTFDGEHLAYLAEVEEFEVSADEFNLSLTGDLILAGDQQGLEIKSCRIDCGEGRIDLAGALSWSDGMQWRTEVQFDSFDPSEIGSLPEGSVNGSFSSRGRIAGKDILVETEINTLTGVLSGYELHGGGTMVYRDQVLTIAGLNITNGNNRLYATGTVTDEFDLNFLFNGAELELILPQLGGTLEVIGVLGGPRHNPQVQFTVKGAELQYQDYFAGSVAADIDLAPADMSSRSTLWIENLDLAGMRAEELTLKAEGTMASHQLDAKLALERVSLEAEASGSVEGRGWQGEIGGIVLSDSQFGIWRQQEASTLLLAAESARLERTCLAGGTNLICAAADWDKSGGWSLALDDLRLALNSLNDWGIIDQKIEGVISANFQAAGHDKSIVSGSGSVSLPELEVDLGPNPYYEQFKWYDTRLTLIIQDEELKTNFHTRFIDDSRLDGTVILPGGMGAADGFAGVPLRGTVEADIKDLDILSVVTSNFLLPEGSLSAILNLDGTLGTPQVSGDVLLQDGELRIPMLGAHLFEVAGTMGFEGRRLVLDLNGRSGSGTIGAAGLFDFGTEPWQGSLTISGVDAELINRRAITLTADPELELEIGPLGGSLVGKVAVSQALIEVEKIDRSASESSDVVFVDTAVESSSWPFHYDIDVALGKDVQVKGHGLAGRLEGRLNVASNPSNITVGRGFLDIADGSFAIYGSPLTIDRGRLSFNGGPVDNPGLDIKASKKLETAGFGSEGVEVGVYVIGSAADFEIELFAVPSMEDNDILAYILLDKPLSRDGDASAGLVSAAAQAIGLGKGTRLLSDVSSMLPIDDIRVEGRMESEETSLVVGKNLSEQLSVSYDYNLFKNAGSFRVRYEFGKGFSVESRNSMESNAVELLYSLER